MTHRGSGAVAAARKSVNNAQTVGDHARAVDAKREYNIESPSFSARRIGDPTWRRAVPYRAELPTRTHTDNGEAESTDNLVVNIHG